MAIDTEERGSSKSNSPSSSGIDSNETSNKGNKKVILIVLIVIGVLTVMGILATLAAAFVFKEAAEQTFEATTGGQIETNNDGTEVTYEDKDGNSLKSSAEMPENFPSSVPIYENADIVNSTSYSYGESGDGETFALTFATKDSAKDIYDFYKQELSSNGWKTVSTRSGSGLSSVTATNESENIYASASIVTDDDGETTISLSAKTSFESE